MSDKSADSLMRKPIIQLKVHVYKNNDKNEQHEVWFFPCTANIARRAMIDFSCLSAWQKHGSSRLVAQYSAQQRRGNGGRILTIFCPVKWNIFNIHHTCCQTGAAADCLCSPSVISVSIPLDVYLHALWLPSSQVNFHRAQDKTCVRV